MCKFRSQIGHTHAKVGEVPGVGSDDVVAVGGKTNESGINSILSPAAAQQYARLLAQLLVLPRDETWPSWLVPT